MFPYGVVPNGDAFCVCQKTGHCEQWRTLVWGSPKYFGLFSVDFPVFERLLGALFSSVRKISIAPTVCFHRSGVSPPWLREMLL